MIQDRRMTLKKPKKRNKQKNQEYMNYVAMLLGK
jgi:hypothetical protein